MKRERIAQVIKTYLLNLHVQPHSVNAEYARGWTDATHELLHSIKDLKGYVSKELELI